MNQLSQLFIILLFFALGECLSSLIGRFIPGNVIGMLLLFGALQLRWVKAPGVDQAATFLTQNMGIFFVPAGVGVVEQLDLIRVHWLPIVASAVLGTIITIAFIAIVAQGIERYKECQEPSDSSIL